jgi:hypothetical protein
LYALVSPRPEDQNWNLETLNVSSCWRVSMAAILHVVQRCKILQVLALRRLDCVTDATLLKLPIACPSLSYVDVSHCPNVSFTALARVRREYAWITFDGTGLDREHKQYSKLRSNASTRALRGLVAQENRTTTKRLMGNLKHSHTHHMRKTHASTDASSMARQKRQQTLKTQAMDSASRDQSLFDAVKLGRNAKEMDDVLNGYFTFVHDMKAKKQIKYASAKSSSTQTMYNSRGPSSRRNSNTNSRRNSRSNSGDHGHEIVSLHQNNVGNGNNVIRLARPPSAHKKRRAKLASSHLQ